MSRRMEEKQIVSKLNKFIVVMRATEATTRRAYRQHIICIGWGPPRKCFILFQKCVRVPFEEKRPTLNNRTDWWRSIWWLARKNTETIFVPFLTFDTHFLHRTIAVRNHFSAISIVSVLFLTLSVFQWLFTKRWENVCVCVSVSVSLMETFSTIYSHFRGFKHGVFIFSLTLPL